jgi:hypothetical protein
MADSNHIEVKPNPQDVLLGRGDWTVRYEGNVRFRELIREKRNLFGAATGRNARDKIASDMIRIIAERGGRFLRRDIEPDESKRDDTSPMESTWHVVDQKTAMKKVKQAFRDKDSWTQAVLPSSQSSADIPLDHLSQPAQAERFHRETYQPMAALPAVQSQVAPSMDQNLNRLELERALRVSAYQRLETEAIRAAARTTELERLRQATTLSRNPLQISQFPLDLQQTLGSDFSVDAVRAATRATELERLRQVAALNRDSQLSLVLQQMDRGTEARTSSVQQMLLSIQEQQRQLQQVELSVRVAMLTSNPLSQIATTNSAPYVPGLFPNLPGGTLSFDLQQQDTLRQLNQLRQRLEESETHREVASLSSFPRSNDSIGMDESLTPVQSNFRNGLDGGRNQESSDMVRAALLASSSSSAPMSVSSIHEGSINSDRISQTRFPSDAAEHIAENLRVIQDDDNRKRKRQDCDTKTRET